jgi:hypothetical protein
MTSYKLHDIICYNKQGTFDVAIIVKVIIQDSGVLYELSTGATILDHNIVCFLDNSAYVKARYEQE